ncbi:hypothetical protein FHS78_000613 [Parvibaculum indicum]|uniref:hypothetical protein n=1 Tax=Parvibaculum indicum TaxID=562969 RepID=UPI00142147C8|nr:hypothetical protein [Parvibaculum indicum]NIJ40343.1 hypothetical protein [Parvibaculum indicum]
MIDLDELAVDTKLFEEGKKVEFGEDSHIRIRSAGSTRAQKIREELWKPYATWTDIPKDVLDSLNAQWIAKGLLTEFVGFAADGNLLTFDLSKEEDCERLGLILKAPKYKALRNRFIQISLDEKNFQQANDAVLEKNSGRSRTGSSSGANTPNE